MCAYDSEHNERIAIGEKRKETAIITDKISASIAPQLRFKLGVHISFQRKQTNGKKKKKPQAAVHTCDVAIMSRPPNKIGNAYF